MKHCKVGSPCHNTNIIFMSLNLIGFGSSKQIPRVKRWVIWSFTEPWQRWGEKFCDKISYCGLDLEFAQ